MPSFWMESGRVRRVDRVPQDAPERGRKHPWLPRLVRFGLLFGSCSSCLCFASGFLPTPHYCDAVAFGYLISLCQRLIGDLHPSYVSCLTYPKKPAFRKGVGRRASVLGQMFALKFTLATQLAPIRTKRPFDKVI